MDVKWLREKALVRERPFISNAPVVGRLVARFREAWNNVSTTWYVRPLLQQQNEFNEVVVQQLQTLDTQLHILDEKLHEQLHDLNARVVAQDKEQTGLIHDSAEITAQLIQLNRLLQSIDERLGRLEGAVGSER